MKKIFTIAAILFAFYASAQKSDTLVVPVGEYHFIKIGDKVYKINISLEEVKEDSIPIFRIGGSLTTPGYITPYHLQNDGVWHGSTLLGKVEEDSK